MARFRIGREAIPILDAASLTLVREEVRAAGRALKAEIVERMVLCATELGTNQLAHARSGRILVRAIERAGTPGIEVIAADGGHGIYDPAAVLEGKPRATGSLGVGLSSVRRLAFEVDFDIRLGEGTLVYARAFAGPVERAREIGIFGVACPGEAESGDDAAFVRDGMDVYLTLADGLGHGGAARDASSLAVDVFLNDPRRDGEAILLACDERLKSTRGAVMAAVHVDHRAREVHASSIGNIMVRRERHRDTWSMTGSASVVGRRGPGRVRMVSESTSFDRHDALVVFSDGLKSRANADGISLREHPIVIAQRLVESYARHDDDVLVAVAR